MSRTVDGSVHVRGIRFTGERTSPVRIKIRGKLHPVRKTSFIEELRRLAKHYGLTATFPLRKRAKKKAKKRAKKK